MGVFDCATRQAREHTADELAAIDAEKAAYAARPLREPDGLGEVTLRDFAQALVAEGVMTLTQAQGVRDRLKRR